MSELQGTSQLLPTEKLNQKAEILLGYNPSYEVVSSNTIHSTSIMVTCHGYGANKDIGQYVSQHVDLPVITFNFPDHDIDDEFVIEQSSFGTIREYLPLIYLLQAAVKQGITSISLYGFSAGGGAVINTLAVLNTNTYEAELTRIGVSREDAKKILEAISSGILLLDTPLKSLEEILAFRPDDSSIQVLTPRYKANTFEPIDNLINLKGLSLSIIIYFEIPDEILSNRDDELYYQRLCAINGKDTTKLITDQDGGHMGPHTKLWKTYQMISKKD